ncbi:MAG TPA: hypothetical protein VFT82_04035 [Candidatus Paceibacterota bacterium]|nr:hypothetical protein [Candidatus Paceibacterota bacterium]
MKIIRLIKALYQLALALFVLAGFFIAAAASWLLTKVLGWFKIGDVIAVKDTLMTPTVTLVHPKTGRKVVIIGVMHMGRPGYFEEIQKAIEKLSGYKVLFEGVGRLTDEEKAGLTPDERRIFDQFDAAMKSRNVIQILLGLSGQTDDLKYDPSWIRTDMRMIDFIRRFDEAKVDPFPTMKVSTLQKLLEKETESKLFAWVFDLILFRLPALFFCFDLVGRFRKKESVRKQVILDERNAIAVDGILRESVSADVVTIWGAAHLPGMIARLRAAGFRKTAKTWMPVYERRKGLLGEFWKSFRERVSKDAAERIAARRAAVVE